MTSLIVNYFVQEEITRTAGDAQRQTRNVIVPRKMQMSLKVTPDSVEEASTLGIFEVQISIDEAWRPFPEMTMEQARVWMIDILKKTL
ncbi:hypothetical protein AD945_10040 [Gluconobacter albidus]|uniref:Uncharacterized protein n=1 Tax=Gluconobacter albidus TaxID=318683 RepID=A0A149THJ9_9PROT|nr:hypothetical protein [Gluconobacter albidus]KXV47384.1 hypothetical protein AD945_10040 [Gluconobacter albidus]